ncbi:unnamed protein product [Acanthoscelides obtectus]|uniref:Uncharacterized protein n=1 Tax=Acanthoscelides obtectus TaxID=200917 RepID=A0A9P0KF14_ACAOB|nr:unnamed protein product [Acanthoscelides obtectus]CAK1632325.1 hypothetical protein AOBTE_LOCUS7484 [Acanthoscelides obtectus]
MTIEMVGGASPISAAKLFLFGRCFYSEQAIGIGPQKTSNLMDGSSTGCRRYDENCWKNLGACTVCEIREHVSGSAAADQPELKSVTS